VTPSANEVAAGRVTDVSHIDCSENSCLSREEQEYWKNYARKPKAYHSRLNTSEYKGHKLKKFSFCFIKYKESEIMEHEQDCAPKIYGGKNKFGLYDVDIKPRLKKRRKATPQKKNPPSRNTPPCSKKTKVVGGVIHIDD